MPCAPYVAFFSNNPGRLTGSPTPNLARDCQAVGIRTSPTVRLLSVLLRQAADKLLILHQTLDRLGQRVIDVLFVGGGKLYY